MLSVGFVLWLGAGCGGGSGGSFQLMEYGDVGGGSVGHGQVFGMDVEHLWQSGAGSATVPNPDGSGFMPVQLDQGALWVDRPVNAPDNTAHVGRSTNAELVRVDIYGEVVATVSGAAVDGPGVLAWSPDGGGMWSPLDQNGVRGTVAYTFVDDVATPVAAPPIAVRDLYAPGGGTFWALVMDPADAWRVSMMRFDGAEWIAVPEADRTESLTDGYVASDGPDDVWFVASSESTNGEEDTRAMLHWDGAELTSHAIPEPELKISTMLQHEPGFVVVDGSLWRIGAISASWNYLEAHEWRGDHWGPTKTLAKSSAMLGSASSARVIDDGTVVVGFAGEIYAGKL